MVEFLLAVVLIAPINLPDSGPRTLRLRVFLEGCEPSTEARSPAQVSRLVQPAQAWICVGDIGAVA